MSHLPNAFGQRSFLMAPKHLVQKKMPSKENPIIVEIALKKFNLQLCGVEENIQRGRSITTWT